MKVYRQVVGALIVSLLSGCFRPSFEPSGVVVDADASRQACEDINASQKRVTSLRVLADATVFSDSERATFRYVILSKEPSSFRVDVLPVNGALTLGLLVAHQGKAVWLDAQEKTFAESADEGELVAEYLGLKGVSRKTVVALLTGTLPPLSCANVRLYQLPSGDRLFVDDQAKAAWRVKETSATPLSLQVLDDSGDGVVMEATFAGGRDSSENGVTLEVFSPARARVDLDLARVVYDPPLSDQLFQIKPPRDYTRVD